MPRYGAGLLVLMLGLGGAPIAGATSWYEYYGPAEAALAQGDLEAKSGNQAAAVHAYSTAAQLLNQAIALRPRPLQWARTYGINHIQYLPYYQIGRAYEGLGQARQAIVSYEKELAKGAILEAPELAEDLRRRLGRLQAQLAPSPTATPRPPPTSTPTTPTPPQQREPRETSTPSRTWTPSRTSTPRRSSPTRTRTASPTPRLRHTPSLTPSPSVTTQATAPASATPDPTATPSPTPTAFLEPRYDQPEPGLFQLAFTAFDPRGIERVELYIDDAFQNAWDNPALDLRLQESYEFSLPDGTYQAKLVLLSSGGIRGISRQELLRSGSAPWGPLLLAIPISALSAVGGSFVVRRRRRRRALDRNFNPYIAGSPVQKDDMFFGRTALLQQVLSTLHNNSLLLFGERRIGKTSLLHSIYRHVQGLKDSDHEFHPVLIDLEGVPEEGFFPILISEILAQLDKKLGSLPVRWKPDLPKAEYDASDFVHDLRLIVRHLREGTTKMPKLLLLLDEVDVLNTFSSRTNQRLRSLFMKTFGQHLGLVMAGVGIRKSWDSEGSPWYNFFEEIPVRPFSAEEARDLIRRPVEGVFSYSKEAVEKIIDACECKPYLIQRCCIACVNRVSAAGRFAISEQDVEAVLPNVLGGWE